MYPNDAGKMIEKWYYELQNKFPDIKCDEMIVMPNHFHCIIHNVGADLRVCPNPNPNPNTTTETTPDKFPNIKNEMLGERDRNILGERDENMLGEREITGKQDADENDDGERVLLGEHIGSPLHGVLQWFKTMTTNEYIRGVKTLGWQRFNRKLWQRNYWEHIIRDETSHRNIVNYILNNPQKWDGDKFNPKTT